MDLIKIELKNYSQLNCDFSIAEDNSILYAKISGTYRKGTEGNPDGLYMYSLLAAHYFISEPICLILDLTNLDYSWGNTIVKSLNFFYEVGREEDERDKTIIIIPSEKNGDSIKALLEMINGGNRVLCRDDEEAFKIAVKRIEAYLGN